MFLNTLKPSPGSRPERRRVGRGIGCTLGKTCGKGHKGQKARAGGFHKRGFEGGQMPLQRRLPKIGFVSHKKLGFAQITLGDLAKVGGGQINIQSLRAAKIIRRRTLQVTVVDRGAISAPITISGIRVTKGARSKIEVAGGKVEV